jgi:hypothetical protein
MAELRISYAPDDEWMGETTVRVVSEGFAGTTAAWIGVRDIRDFAKSLDRYPMPPEQPSVFEAGLGGTLDGRKPPQTLVRVTVKPQGVRGDLLVRAELATEVWENEDADCRQMVVARFMTEYALVERFARSLEGVASGRIEEAVLEGKPG